MGAESALVTLGRFELHVGNRAVPALPTQKSRALVTFLVSNRGRDVARERLLELFWNEFEPERAREGLRTALSTIRRGLRDADVDPAEMLLTDKSIVRWIAPTALDSDRFADLAQSTNLNDHAAALELYAGDFLEGNYEQWTVAERERLSGLYETLLAGVVKRSSDTETARALLVRNPYDESAYATLIEAELKANRPTAAAELLERYRAAMAEMNAELSPQFEARFASIAELADAGDEQLRVPFVARSAELQSLTAAFRERVGTDGYLAIISGDAGIGKSSLIAKALEMGRGEGRRCLLVRCTQDDPRRMDVWQTLYERMQEPSVLFVDDAHNLRGDALAAFAHIARLARSAGHGIVIALRPEGIAAIDEALGARADDRLELGPLQRADIETAVALTVDVGTSSLADTLYERSGGHPLFFVALLQSLVQKQALRRERGRWRVVRALDEELELPQNLRASIDARLHAAGDDAAVIACALALEPSASAEDLAFALDYPEPRVLDALDDLLGYALIRESTASSFEFSHDVVREVAAGILNPGRRVALHRGFARRFEQSALPEAKVQLARHYRAAGMSAFAAAAYLDAAQNALKQYAFRDALECADDALRVVERLEQTGDAEATQSHLQLIRAQAAAQMGDIPVAIAAADEAVRHARVGMQNNDVASALVVRASLHGALADPAVQLSDALEASALAAELADERLRARAATEAASAARTAGAADQALQLAREACNAAQQCGDADALYAAYDELLKSLVSWWRFDEAKRVLAEAAPIAERAGISAMARLSCLHAACAYLLEQPHQARQHVTAALQQIKTLREPIPLISFTAQYLRGTLAAARSDWNEQFDAAQACNAHETITQLPRYANAVVLLDIDARLGRRAAGDVECATQLLARLTTSMPQSIYGWSDCIELARARLAARLRTPNARADLRTALDAIEEQARRIPLDCDRAFARLAYAAEEAAETGIRDRAAARSAYYRAMRTAAATSTLFASTSGASQQQAGV